jgi:cysteine synthase
MYTGPEIARVLGKDIAAIAIAMGSGGTAAGVGKFFHEESPGTVVLGVRPSLGERVPGARDKARMEEVVTLPWKDSVDFVVELSRKKAFIHTRELWSAVEPQPGPSSGLAYGGLMQYLGSMGSEELERFRGKSAGFLCPDGGMLYSDLMSAELDTGQGFPIQI